jgi:hypothetical protein
MSVPPLAGGRLYRVWAGLLAGQGVAKEPVLHALKHLVLVSVRVVWHKHRFWCDSDDCPRATFADAGPLAGPGPGGVSARQDGDGASERGLAGAGVAGRGGLRDELAERARGVRRRGRRRADRGE